MPQPDVIELIAAIDEDRAPREPEPPPPPEPATPLEDVEARSSETPSGANSLVAHVRKLPPNERMRALRGLLHEITKWYYPIKNKLRVGRRVVTDIEYVVGAPTSNYRCDPIRARRVVDAALALVQVTGVEIQRVGDPMPPHATWGAILDELDALLRGPNLIPLAEHLRNQRAEARARNNDNRAFKQDCDRLMLEFLDGRIEDDSQSTEPTRER